MNILIVEDEIVTATDLKNTLEKNGHFVLPVCKNYQEVLRILEEAVPDLLLADIRLRNSGMDGIQIASEITARHAIPIIYLTSYTDQQTFERARGTQPAAYLFKPFRKEELVFQIELALEHYKVNESTRSDLLENVFFPVGRGHQKIDKQSVLFIKAEGAYVNIFTIERQSPIMLSMNLGYVSQFFATSNFYKLSRSYLLNLDHVDRFDTDYVYFRESVEKAPIPQTKKQEFLRMFALVKTPQR